MVLFLLCSLLTLKFIPHPPYGFDEVAFFAHFASKLLDMGINSSGVTEIIIVPNVVQYFLTGKGNSLIFKEIR